jgi:organic hydroperoxide reductase OsmC/OhrA
VTELVWDASRAGTATAASGATLLAGDSTDWTPEELLATAAAACLMRTFLRTADRAALDVLGYVTAADAIRPDGTIRLRVCVVTEGGAAASEARALCLQAVDESPLGRLLGDRLVVDVSARSLGGPAVPGG